MGHLRALIYLGICLSAGIITAEVQDSKAENVRWTSLDFKTMLTWTTKTPQLTYSVRYSWDFSDWEDHPECYQLSRSECDMTIELKALQRSFTADVLTDHENPTPGDYGTEEFQHTESKPFNPYKESNISAVEFTVRAVNESAVLLNITDILTNIHEGVKQLSIRDIFKKDLKYKINYYKSGSTRKKDHTADSSVAEVTKLDPGQSYCFMVAAYIPSRPKNTQYGAWSRQLCETTHGNSQTSHELSSGVLAGIIVILLVALVIAITVIVVCCRKSQERNRPLQTSQSSAPV
ncbi:tissue factor-like [Xyrichtys novacula]|uniref:Tissue factor n=1 Tax=Xyrichtys novacula TaxID=13765 RepID=A0AAV1HNR4_XYRNO|nr:tissue factor-like [Xyrichtys novacula]